MYAFGQYTSQLAYSIDGKLIATIFLNRDDFFGNSKLNVLCYQNIKKSNLKMFEAALL